jgi:ABC-type polysaccharide/polyol phosphate export permease
MDVVGVMRQSTYWKFETMAPPIPTAAPRMTDYLLDGALEMVRGISSWRAWQAFSHNDVKRRYRRSRLGQLWYTLSMALFIMGLSLVLGGLFKSSILGILPWFAINLIIWTYISTVVVESCNCFVEAEHYMKQVALPHGTYIIRILYRNLIILAHNLIIVPIVLLYTLTPVGWVALLSIVGLALVVLQLLWISIVLATFTARFRDIPQLVQNVVQMLFFMSPIMFKPEQMSPDVWAWLKWNPVQSMLALVRDPLLGAVPPMEDYLYVLATMFFGYLLALIVLGRFRNRLIYWV